MEDRSFEVQKPAVVASEESSFLQDELNRMVKLCSSLQSQLLSVTEDADRQQKYLCNRLSAFEEEAEALRFERDLLQKEIRFLKENFKKNSVSSTLNRVKATCPEKHIEEKNSDCESPAPFLSITKRAASESTVSSIITRMPSERVLKGQESSSSSDTNDIFSVYVTNDWVEELSIHPTPPFDLDSPVIKLLIKEWSADLEKQMYINYWLSCAAHYDVLPQGFPTGLQLIFLSAVVKDGFIILIVPILRKRKDARLEVFIRKSPSGSNTNDLWDLRLRISGSLVPPSINNVKDPNLTRSTNSILHRRQSS